MTQLFQQLITAVSIGGLYALLAVGYALIYSVFDFTNFAFGAVMMVSAFSGYYATQAGLSVIPATGVAVLAGMAISVLTELLAYRPMRKRNTKRLYLMISAMGINIFITNLFLCLFGANMRNLESGLVTKTISLGKGITVGTIDLLALGTSVIALTALTFSCIRLAPASRSVPAPLICLPPD